jgi:hypothetical protein
VELVISSSDGNDPKSETLGAAYTLSLLTDLRDLTSKIADQHARLTYELHTLLNTVANPNIHDLEGLC